MNILMQNMAKKGTNFANDKDAEEASLILNKASVVSSAFAVPSNMLEMTFSFESSVQGNCMTRSKPMFYQIIIDM